MKHFKIIVFDSLGKVRFYSRLPNILSSITTFQSVWPYVGDNTLISYQVTGCRKNIASTYVASTPILILLFLICH